MSSPKVIHLRKEALQTTKRSSSRNKTQSRPSILMTLDTPVAPAKKIKESIITLAPSLPTPPTSPSVIEMTTMSPPSIAQSTAVHKDPISRKISFDPGCEEYDDPRDVENNTHVVEDSNVSSSSNQITTATTNTLNHLTTHDQTLLTASIAALSRTIQRTEQHSIDSLGEASLLSMNIFRSEIGSLTETIERFRLAQEKHKKVKMHDIHTQTSPMSASYAQVVNDMNESRRNNILSLPPSNSAIHLAANVMPMGAGSVGVSFKEVTEKGTTNPTQSHCSSHPIIVRLMELDIALKRYLSNNVC